MANPLHEVPHIPDSLLDVAVDPRKEPELATDLLRQRLGHELEEIERLRTIAASLGGGLLPAGAGGAGGGSLVANKLTEGLRSDLGGQAEAMQFSGDASAPRRNTDSAFGTGEGTEADNLAAARNSTPVGRGLLRTGRCATAMPPSLITL